MESSLSVIGNSSVSPTEYVLRFCVDFGNPNQSVESIHYLLQQSPKQDWFSAYDPLKDAWDSDPIGTLVGFCLNYFQQFHSVITSQVLICELQQAGTDSNLLMRISSVLTRIHGLHLNKSSLDYYLRHLRISHEAMLAKEIMIKTNKDYFHRGDFEAGIDFMKSQVVRLNRDAGSRERTVSFRELAPDLWRDYEQRELHPGMEKGIPTGLTSYDEKWPMGLGAGEVTVIAGRTSHGKSLLIGQLCKYANRICERNVVLAGNEMYPRQYVERILSSHLKADYYRYMQGQLSVKEKVTLLNVLVGYNQSPNEFYFMPPRLCRDTETLRNELEILCDLTKIDMVAVDHMQRMSSSRSKSRWSEREEQKAVVEDLEIAAQDLELTLLTGVQWNRENAAKLDAETEGIALCDFIGNNVPRVWRIYRDKDDETRVCIFIIKERQGPKLVKLDFQCTWSQYWLGDEDPYPAQGDVKETYWPMRWSDKI